MIIRNEKVLIVDDAKFTRSIIKTTLKNLGFLNFFEADSVRDAIPVYQQIIPELVTMDINISGDSGLDGLRKIKEINPDSKIIVISAASTHENIIKAYSFGAAHFLSKPITVESVTAAFEKVLPGPISINLQACSNAHVSLNKEDPFNAQGSSSTPASVKAPVTKAAILRLENDNIKINCHSGHIIGRCNICKTAAELSKNNQKCNIDNLEKNFIPCKQITVDIEQAKFIFENSSFYIIPLSRAFTTRLNGAELDVSKKYAVKSGDIVSFGICYFKVTIQ